MSVSAPSPRVIDRLVATLKAGPFIQILLLVAAWVAAVSTISGLGSLTSIYSILILASFLGIAAAGQTVVVLVGGIDLSVPSVIGASNILAALWTGMGIPFWIVLLMVLGAAAVIGVANGYISYRFGLPPLIVTLATGAILLGLSLVATGGGNSTADVPQWLSVFSSPIGSVGPIPIPPVILLWALLAIGIAYVLHATAAGARLYAAGSSPRAAELSFVKVGRVWMLAFLLSAGCSALLGVILLGFSGSGQPNIGEPYLFTSLAAVLVGGTSLLGGQGDYWRTILGALLITLLSLLLVGFGLGEWAQQVITGVIIFAAVGLYGREVRLRDRV